MGTLSFASEALAANVSVAIGRDPFATNPIYFEDVDDITDLTLSSIWVNLGSGFILDVRANLLNCSEVTVLKEIEALRARGVRVCHECITVVPSDTCS